MSATAMRPYDDLQRFVDAQDGVFEDVRRELRSGHKQSHWMWFVFPQLRGLGHSVAARYYGIESGAEATAYLRHPVLGPRLRECTELVLAIRGRTAHEIFGTPDDLKFRSSMTLFSAVESAGSVFEQALQRYFDAAPDPLTVERLRAG